MKIGAARTGITPENMGSDLWGYGFYLDRKAKGVGDHLYASAVEFSDAGKKALVVSCDIGNLDRSFVKECSGGILAETGYDQINMCASHTHSAPAGCDMRGIGERDKAYMEFLRKQITRVASDAHKNAEEVEMFSATGKAEVNYNRAVPNGETNKRIYMLFAKSASEKIKSIIYNYAAHPVNAPKVDQGPESFLISAGFPGYTNSALSGVKGGIPMFLQGSCGDVNIMDQGTFKKAEEHGHVIASEILSAERSKIDDPQMRLGEITVELPAIVPTKKFIDDTLQKLPVINPAFGRLLNEWKQDTLKGIEDDAYTGDLITNVNVLHIGDDACMIFHPFELFTSLDTTIRTRATELGIKTLFLNGYSNDALGYLVPETNEESKAINYATAIIPMVTKAPHLERSAGKAFADQIIQYLETIKYLEELKSRNNSHMDFKY